MIKLGSKVRDTISGFEGIVTARHEYLNGCVRYSISATSLDENGKMFDEAWLDDQQVEVIEEMGPEVSKDSTGKPGGPNSSRPPAMKMPRR